VKKIKLLTLATAMVLASSIFLFACNRPGGGSGNTNQPPTTQPPTTQPPVTPPQQRNFSEFFNTSIQTTFLQNTNSTTDVNGNAITFINLVDKQIDVLTTDIIYRLITIYGAGSPNINMGVGSHGEDAFVLTNKQDNNAPYMFGNNKAVISNHNLIQNPSSANSNTASFALNVVSGTIEDNNQFVTQPFVWDVATYAHALRHGSWEPGTVITDAFNFNNAINGGFAFENGAFTDQLNTSRAWALRNSPAFVQSTSLNNPDILLQDFMNLHFNTIRTGIANAVAGTTGLTYNDAIARVTNTGFDQNQQTRIIQFINNSVIGNVAINADNGSRPGTSNQFRLTVANVNMLNANQRQFKAYGFIVNAIVRQAINNTFVGTTQSLYIQRSNVESVTTPMPHQAVTNRNFTSITITPSRQIPLTSLILNLTGISNPNTLRVRFEIIRPGANTVTSVEITPDNTGRVVLNLGQAAGAGATITTTGRINITFTNPNGNPFNIGFTGYMDRN